MAEAAPPPAEGAAEEGGKKKKSKLLIIIAAVVLLAVGGGAAWYFLMHKKPKDGEVEHVEEKIAPPVFVTLDPFTVNLAAESADRYLQVGMDLKVSGAEVGDKIKLHLPEIRNGIVLLLTSKTVDELASLDGKNRLREDIRDIVNKPLGYLKEGKEKPHHSEDDKAAEGKPTEAKTGGAPVESSAEAKHDAGADQMSAPPPSEAEPEKPKPRSAPKEGVLDVLLTSFVIQ